MVYSCTLVLMKASLFFLYIIIIINFNFNLVFETRALVFDAEVRRLWVAEEYGESNKSERF